ncbi:MAG: transcriptional regulator MntR [Phycisphaera sp.]|nr:MAG: transcriptional regulator MntR [Phycisphaera sp.]
MNTTTNNAKVHKRVRHDHSTETAEDYVEAIAEIVDREGTCRVRDLADRFGVSHVTVIRIIRRIEGDGLVVTEPYKPIELTAKGRRLATACSRRHEVVVRFLRAIGISKKTAETDAEGIEHHVSRETLRRFEEIAGAGRL